MDSIDPISSAGPTAIPRRGLPSIDRLERISRERDRPGWEEQRQEPGERERREQPEQGDDEGEQHGHVDVRA
jgi:hypothetical protein